METKICSKCGEEKSVEEFYKNKASRYGYATYCKKCAINYTKEYQNKKRDALAIKGKQYREKNREKRNEYFKEWYKRNKNGKRKEYLEKKKNERAEYRKEYYEKNKEHIIQRMKEWRGENLDRECERVRKWRESHRERENERSRERRKKNINHFRQIDKDLYKKRKETGYLKDYQKNNIITINNKNLKFNKNTCSPEIKDEIEKLITIRNLKLDLRKQRKELEKLK